jgi:hypothetical protein
MQARLVEHQPHLAEEHVDEALPLLDDHVESRRSAGSAQQRRHAMKQPMKTMNAVIAVPPLPARSIHIHFFISRMMCEALA